MGYLTTVTIYNDHWADIKDNPQKFVDDIDNFKSSGTTNRDYIIGQSKVHKTRHADDHTVYVHMGNTVVDTCPYGWEMQRIAREFPKFFDQILNRMERQVEDLKALKQKQEEL